MPSPLGGPGLGLPAATFLYRSELNNAPIDIPTNRLALAPGQSCELPSGTWWVSLGMYLVLQYKDPCNGTWTISTSAAYNRGLFYVRSNGYDVRVANMLGCPIAAVVTTVGAALTQATTTISVTGGGGSTWAPIIGGQLAVPGGTVSSLTSGGGYGVAPILLIPQPPGPTNNANGVGGIAASGWLSIAGGTVSGCTLNNPGAGYPTAPVPVVVPSPFDPNLSTGITAASISFSLTNTGGLTGALCTNSGAPLAATNGITLTVAGAGGSTIGSLAALVLQTLTNATVSGAGTGYGTVNALLTTVGGVPPVAAFVDPYSLGIAWLPRPAQVGLTVTALGTLSVQSGTIYDGGLFLSNAAPSFVVATYPAGATQILGAATIAVTSGAVKDIAYIQSAP
jgi:hypothetical protein